MMHHYNRLTMSPAYEFIASWTGEEKDSKEKKNCTEVWILSFQVVKLSIKL